MFGLTEWINWLNGMTMRAFGMSATEFEQNYVAGAFRGSGHAQDLGSVLELIHRIRVRDANSSQRRESSDPPSS
jgi:hypothetical protein